MQQTTEQKIVQNRKVFVLKLWREQDDKPWRLAIQPRGASLSHGLPSLGALTEFIQTEMQPSQD